MKFNFPRSKHADGISLRKQVDHILSEAEEVKEALENGEHSQVYEELTDLAHSIETLFRMAPNIMDRFRNKVIKKNIARGYYD